MFYWKFEIFYWKIFVLPNTNVDDLCCSIVLRGKLLNSALNSLHNFDRSLDKFLAWLSEAESSLECVEVDADRAGVRRDEVANRQFSKQLKVSTSMFSTIIVSRQ